MKKVNKSEEKHLIAKLLEDAKRLQEIEPNEGTKVRIEEAMKYINSNDAN
jgi:hypothetical protein